MGAVGRDNAPPQASGSNAHNSRVHLVSKPRNYVEPRGGSPPTPCAAHPEPFSCVEVDSLALALPLPLALALALALAPALALALEVRAALNVASDWGYVEAQRATHVDKRLDEVCAITWCLSRRR